MKMLLNRQENGTQWRAKVCLQWLRCISDGFSTHGLWEALFHQSVILFSALRASPFIVLWALPKANQPVIYRQLAFNNIHTSKNKIWFTELLKPGRNFWSVWAVKTFSSNFSKRLINKTIWLNTCCITFFLTQSQKQLFYQPVERIKWCKQYHIPKSHL